MTKHVLKGVYKRVSIMDYFTTRKHRIFLDKVNFCNKCQLKRINNRAERCYACTNCGECKFFSLQLMGEYVSIHIKQ